MSAFFYQKDCKRRLAKSGGMGKWSDSKVSDSVHKEGRKRKVGNKKEGNWKWDKDGVEKGAREREREKGEGESKNGVATLNFALLLFVQ